MEPLSRPTPPRSPAERLRAWVVWFGVGRLVAASVATIVVCAGAVWLVRTPPPATEASLPRASTTTTTTGSSDVDRPHRARRRGAEHRAGPPGPRSRRGRRTGRLPARRRCPGARCDRGRRWPHGDGRLECAQPRRIDLRRRQGLRAGRGRGASTVADRTERRSRRIDPDRPDRRQRCHAAELESLPGVGPATATAIVTERERNGPFLDVDDLDRVPGIGPAKIEALRGLVTT